MKGVLFYIFCGVWDGKCENKGEKRDGTWNGKCGKRNGIWDVQGCGMKMGAFMNFMQ